MSPAVPMKATHEYGARMTPEQAALRYAAQGLYVFPIFEIAEDGTCACGGRVKDCTPGKHPRTRHGVDDGSVHPDAIRGWWRMWPSAAIGVNLEMSGLVDVAPDHPEHLAEFQRRGIETPARFQSPGGEGHVHHLFRRQEACPIHRICRTGEYDILSNGYAILPPSSGEGGRRYRWLSSMPDLNGGLPPAPAWVVDALQAAKVRRTQSAPRRVSIETGGIEDEPPIPLNDHQAAIWRGEIPILKPDGEIDRSATLLRIGRMLWNAGMTRAGVIAAVRERDQALGWDKYSGRGDADTRYTEIGDLLEAEGRDPVVVLNAVPRHVPVPEPVIDPETGEVKRHYEIIDAPDYVNRPEPRWLVPRIIPAQAFFSVYGPPASFKSFWGLDLFASIATGIEFHGCSVESGPCLYIAAEGASGLMLRLKAWEKARGVSLPRDLKILPGVVSLMNAEAIARLIADIRSFDTPFAAVMFDTFSRSIAGADENQQKDMTIAVDAIGRIQADLDAAVGMIHHGTKGTGSLRGSSVLDGALDTIIRITAAGEAVTVHNEKQKDGLNFEDMIFRRVIVPLSPPPDPDTPFVVGGDVSSVVLERMAPEEERAEASKRRTADLTPSQRATLHALDTFSPAGAPKREWLDAARFLSNGDLSRQLFHSHVDVLLKRGFVKVVTERNGEPIYVVDGRYRVEKD